MNKTWMIENSDGSENIYAILEFLLPEYIRIFGHEVMNGETCVVFNDPDSECPMLIHTSPLKIRLSQSNLYYWAQTIFQLSHELCHYALRQNKKVKNYTLSWFEEIVCEAMSLYILKYAVDNWHKCKLSKWDPNFKEKIRHYLFEELDRIPTNDFRECTTIELLFQYESTRCAENYRESQIAERNVIYVSIVNHPEDLRYLLKYTEYVDITSNLVINFWKWKEDCPCDLIEQLEKVQPVKICYQTI